MLYTLEEAMRLAKDIGFPVISRASFTLAGCWKWCCL